MATLVELVECWPRILILYPVYLKISTIIETKFPLVKKVRENPQKYTQIYISVRGSTGSCHDIYQVVELLTEINGKHVEILAALILKPPTDWYLLDKEFQGHTLTEIFDSPLPTCVLRTIKLSENFYSL